MHRLAAAGYFAVASIIGLSEIGSANDSVVIPTFGYEVVNDWPHDPSAYTQGLVVKDGVLYEGTGRYGESSLRIVDLTTGRIKKSVKLAGRYFGEGIAVLGDRLFQLTWRERTGIIYDRRTLARVGDFRYNGEGWGLTTDGHSLIMSDGTDRLLFVSPQTFHTRKILNVRAGNEALHHLNELEYVNGEIFANVWKRDVIARIDPRSGRVLGWIDLGGLLDVASPEAMLNGIAYDAENNRLFVTGKLWPKLFQIRLRPLERR